MTDFNTDVSGTVDGITLDSLDMFAQAYLEANVLD